MAQLQHIRGVTNVVVTNMGSVCIKEPVSIVTKGVRMLIAVTEIRSPAGRAARRRPSIKAEGMAQHQHLRPVIMTASLPVTGHISVRLLMAPVLTVTRAVLMPVIARRIARLLRICAVL